MPNPETSRENGKLGGRPNGSKNLKTLEAEEFRLIFREKVSEKWDSIIEAQLKDAEENSRARQFIIDQMVGKPQITKEIHGVEFFLGDKDSESIE